MLLPKGVSPLTVAGAKMTISTDRADIQSLLAQMRELRAQTQPQLQAPVSPAADMAANGGLRANAPEAPGFQEMLVRAVDSVNQTQQQARQMANAFEMGDPGVSLAQVMVASEKASVSFQALSQVRNRLVEAYQDIMNMPI